MREKKEKGNINNMNGGNKEEKCDSKKRDREDLYLMKRINRIIE